FQQLIPIVYDELRRIAGGYLRRESDAGTIQPTALVHEVYLRLAEQKRVDFRNRAHFFGAAAQIIRRLLLDHARQKGALKRGGDKERVTLEDQLEIPIPNDVNVVALDEALTALETFDPGKARLVELRYFAGLSIPETAELLDSSPTTVKREWTIARAWL